MNIDGLIEIIKETLNRHKLANEGEYARYLWQDEEKGYKLGPLCGYGCAAAVNILYTINEFPSSPESRKAYVNVLKSFQNPATGIFEAETHHHIHTSAHLIAALELFDELPSYPLTDYKEIFTNDGLTNLMNELDWKNNPWPAAHQGAGIYPAAVLSNSVDKEWEKTYFKWLWENCDEKTGFWIKKGEEGVAPLFHHMGASFHYFFNHEYAKMPTRYPEKMIDSLLALYNEKDGAIGNDLCESVGFHEIDWVYSVNHALRQTDGYRRKECISALHRFKDEYISWLSVLDHKKDDAFNDMHLLFGAVCALAELQTALPGEIETKNPLRLVLDRRPFI